MVTRVLEQFQDVMYHPITYGSWAFGSIKNIFLSSIGNVIRDSLFFPDPYRNLTQHIIEECGDVLNPEISDPIHYPRKKETLELFTQEEKSIDFKLGNEVFRAKLLIFSTNFENATETHTTVRVGGADETLSLSSIRLMPFLTSFSDHSKKTKNLRFIQLSLFDVDHLNGNDYTPRKPSCFKEVGQIVFSILDELRKQGFAIDSMICHSMGSVSLENLDEYDPDRVPKSLILDRALPSVWKVARQILNPISYYIIYFLAYCSNWTGDPEQSLKRFFSKMKENPQHAKSLSERNVVIIETTHDFYFSGYGAFDKTLDKFLTNLGVNAFQHEFFPNLLRTHVRAHHALPLNFLSNTTKTEIGTGYFPIKPHQSVACAIVHNIFLKNIKNE